MSNILKVAVSQRVDVWADRGERRDALDQRLCRWLMAAGCMPMPVPNTLSAPLTPDSSLALEALQNQGVVGRVLTRHVGLKPDLRPNGLSGLMAGYDEEWQGLQSWLLAAKPDAVLLSGGNDIGDASERDDTERRLLDYAKDRTLPVLGICRGMQMMAVWAGGSLAPVSDHVRTRHRLQAVAGSGEWPDEVNSFHNFALAECPYGFVVTARAEDGTIEAMRHATLPWEGWMWHPEREPVFAPCDIERLRALFA